MSNTSRLFGLLISNSLSFDERRVAEDVSHRLNLEELLEQLKTAELIVVPTASPPSSLLAEIIKSASIKVVMFPTLGSGTISFSPMDTVKHISTTVCSFLKKLFPEQHTMLYGVLSIQSGAQLNNSPAPGSFLWTLKTYDWIKLQVDLLDLVIAAALVDPFTARPKTALIFSSRNYAGQCLTPDQLIGDVYDMALSLLTADPQQNGIRLLVSKLIPSIKWT